MTEDAYDAHILAVIAENGYTDPVKLPDGRWAVTTRLAFTVAILAGIEENTYDDRWCYASHEKARQALLDWALNFDTQSEPAGWHRHPASGRRRDEHGNEFIHW